MAELADDILNTFPFLRTAPEAVQADFATQAIRHTLAPAQFVFMEGDRCHLLPLVIDGSARVYKTGDTGRELTLYRIRRGESCILTVSCILGTRPFPAFAVTETEVNALLIPSTVFRQWVRVHEVWRTYAFDLLSQRLVDMIETVEEVAFRRLDARVAAHLLGADASVVTTTHETIATELGSSREVVSRVLKEFERDGMVSLTRGAIGIVDAGRLRARADSTASVT